jgi:uncharacterized protein (TIGR00369 family)
MTREDLQKILDDNFAEWVQALDLTVTDTTADLTIVRMPLGDHLARVGGIVSGQALAALADTSMVLAALAHVQEFRLFATTDLHTQFLRPGVGSAILCHAEIVRAGKALIFARATMFEETSGKTVATATATFYAP